MKILFLGTGSAWGLPEHACDCAVCRKMNEIGEERTRTSFLVEDGERILVDCGPDIRQQMRAHQLKCPDAVLITHEHADHFLGLDELLAYRRALPADQWRPLPVYATEQAWESVAARFGYLVGSLIEKRIAVSGQSLDGLQMRVTPFKTYHGPSAAGSVGYVIESSKDGTPFKIVYTSDFVRIDHEPDILQEPDVLIIQAHWLNEPTLNRPNHMSFQNALDYIARWKPKKATLLVHMSDGEPVPGDPHNSALKKLAPEAPLTDAHGKPYPVPRCHDEWQTVVEDIRKQHGLPCPITVARDGMVRDSPR